MSHTTSIKAIKISSITALQAAIAELNQMGVQLTLVQNATPRAFYSNQEGMGKADYVIQLAGAKYDVGLYKAEDGNGYEARTDFWNGEVERVLGATPRTAENAMQAKLGRLYQLYGVHATMEQARRKGQTVRRLQKQDGTISLEITGAM